MKGSLAEGVLPGVLRDLYVGRKSGLLHFLRDDERRSVRFRHGHIINADTNVRRERLGETLVRLGQLTQQDLDRATEVVIRDKKRLGAALQELGIMDLGRVEDALALQVREVLLIVMGWSEGEYAFEEEDPHAAPQGEITLKLSTGEMILEAVRRIEDPDVVRYALGDIDRALAPSSDPLLRFQRIALSPTDGFVLSRVDGTLSAREIVQMSPLDPAETQRSLFGLLCTGVIEPVAGSSKPRPQPGAGRPAAKSPAAPPPAVPPGETSALPPTSRPAAPWSSGRMQPLASDEPGAGSPPYSSGPPLLSPNVTMPGPAAAAAAVFPADPAKRKQVEERRREIEDAYRVLKAKNHFELLEVPRASNEAQIKDAYFRLARRFHPDAHHDPSLTDLRDKLEAVFIRLGEAYEVLRSPKTRGNYEASLPRPASGPAMPSAPQASAPPVNHDYEVSVATDNVGRAEKQMAEAKYWDAIQLLEPAIPLLTGKPKQRARLNLARCFAKNPNWLRRAEDLLQLVVQEDPKNADAYFELGLIYKGGGLRSRALSVFRKALEIRPEHEGAQQELLSLDAEKGDAEPPPSGGLLKKLFRKQ